MRLAQGDDEVADPLAEQRQATDDRRRGLRRPPGRRRRRERGPAPRRRRGPDRDHRRLRSSIDDGSAAPEVVLDAYTTAIDSLLELEGALASRSGLPELSSDPDRQPHPVEGPRRPGRCAQPRSPHRDRRTVPVRRLREPGRAGGRGGAPVRSPGGVPGRLDDHRSCATPWPTQAVRDADALLAAVMDEGVIGGSGDPWRGPRTTGRLSRRLADQPSAAPSAATLDATIATADAAAFEADKSARLYLIGTGRGRHPLHPAGQPPGPPDQPPPAAPDRGGQPARHRRAAPPGRGPAFAGRAGRQPEPLVPLEVDSSDEIGQLAEAFNAIQEVTSRGRRGAGRPAPPGHRRHLRQPGPPQPVAARPPDRVHRRPRGPGAGPRPAREPLQARPPRHPDAAQRREPARPGRRRAAPPPGPPGRAGRRRPGGHR